MGRWQPDARGRLQLAALELYGERGFEETTVADIAGRAGVTERTFFRHFADKREVLFDGAAELERRAVEGIVGAPASATPVAAVGAGMAAAVAPMQEGRDYSRMRAAVIAGTTSLQERELLKLAALTAAAAAALHRRGVPEPTASLAAEVGITAFKVGFGWWVGDEPPGTITECVEAALEQLRALTAAPIPAGKADE